ncbi:MAG: PQQ-binding-like beta-propeller repeat protein [Verrucomicrobiota bacterium]
MKVKPAALTPLFALLWLAGPLGAGADWPMLRGDARHTGFVPEELKPPFRLAWACEIEGERLGTAMEPILAGGKLFVATHAGHLYALRAESGAGLWRFEAQGAFLHSPAVAEGLVVAASADGSLYAVGADSGQSAWHCFAGYGGFSAAPVIAGDAIYIGTRAGDFLALSARDGKPLWRQSAGVPIRQTAAVADGQVFVTGEDLKVRCFRAADGKLLWTSEPLPGQTARDYYPIVLAGKGRTLVVVRTNPILNMGQRIGRDRTLLCRNAGVDDSSWQKVEAWLKSAQARGNPELWAREQKAIVAYLEANRDARSFFVLEAATGKEAFTAPVLWIAGCQGVGAQPALTADGRLLVFYRSAYGNWNYGVAPLVALGLLDLEQNQITPLFHQQGPQPHWNCFWGTADESQNFLVLGPTAWLIHQGTLSGFDLRNNELFPIWGERDTYGGFRNPPWARNEWHGPARSGVAVAGHRIYWQTGSRILCLVAGGPTPAQEPPRPLAVAKDIPASSAPPPPLPGPQEIRRQLVAQTEAVLGRNWAPLFTDPGLAGRVFSFDHSGELFEALAWAWPHLPAELQAKTRMLLRSEWRRHPPFTRQGRYPLDAGERREWFPVPPAYCARLGGDRQPHPFGNLYVAWLFAQRCGEEPLVLEAWPDLKAAFEDFAKSGWRLDAAKGDLFANRYLASLLALGRLADQAGDSALALQAKARSQETAQALIAWWNRAAEHGTLKTFNTSSELDPFIGQGDALWLAVAPHRHKLGLFQDLTPEVAALVRGQAPDAVQRVWQTFTALCPTWPLLGEERQVHFGENFLDPPDFALNCFKALAWLKEPSPEELARRVDLPYCRADLYYIIKLALALEARRDAK